MLILFTTAALQVTVLEDGERRETYRSGSGGRPGGTIVPWTGNHTYFHLITTSAFR
jgi:hypothetical protein